MSFLCLISSEKESFLCVMWSWVTITPHRSRLLSIPARILHGLSLLSAIIYSIDSVLCVQQTWSRIAFAFFGLKALSLLEVKEKKNERNQIEWEASNLVNLTLLDSEQIFLGHLHQGKGFFLALNKYWRFSEWEVDWRSFLRYLLSR